MIAQEKLATLLTAWAQLHHEKMSLPYEGIFGHDEETCDREECERCGLSLKIGDAERAVLVAAYEVAGIDYEAARARARHVHEVGWAEDTARFEEIHRLDKAEIALIRWQAQLIPQSSEQTDEEYGHKVAAALLVATEADVPEGHREALSSLHTREDWMQRNIVVYRLGEDSDD